jgi:hypothetical protein
LIQNMSGNSPQVAGGGPGSVAPVGPFSHTNPYPSQESANSLQKAIASMEEKGLQDDPRYAQLLALRNRTLHPQDPGSQLRPVCFK